MALSNYATNMAVVRKSDGTVLNTIWCNIYNEDEWITDEQTVIPFGNLAVQPGDTYDFEDEHFYHNGEKVIPMEELLADMKAALERLGVE